MKFFSYLKIKGEKLFNFSFVCCETVSKCLFRKMERDSETIKMDSRLSNKKLSQFSTRFYTVLQLVSANGDYEKTLQVKQTR